MKLFVPYIAPSTNTMYAGQHWSDRAKHKKSALLAVSFALLDSGQLKTTFVKPVKIEIEPCLGKGRRSYDVSNYSYTYKLIEDCLVERGVLAGDSVDKVRTLVFRSPVRSKETGITLEILETEL